MYSFQKGEEADLIEFSETYAVEDEAKALHPLSITVERCNPTDSVLSAIRSILRMCPNISDLSLARMHIGGDKRAKPFFAVIANRYQAGRGRRGLTFLQLAECHLDDSDSRLLVNSVIRRNMQGAFSSPLVMLNIQGNRITSRGAEILAFLLGQDTSLRELDLSGNRIGDEGVAELSTVLSTNSVLKVLRLSDNRIYQQGAKAIAKSIGQGACAEQTLEELYLSGNRIGSVGTKFLCRSLQHNFTLKTLDLSSNGIGDVGAKLLIKLVEKNLTLNELILHGNGIGICYCKGCVLKRVDQGHSVFSMAPAGAGQAPLPPLLRQQKPGGEKGAANIEEESEGSNESSSSGAGGQRRRKGGLGPHTESLPSISSADSGLLLR